MICIRKIVAVFLCVTMVLGSTLTSFASKDLELIENSVEASEELDNVEASEDSVGEENEIVEAREDSVGADNENVEASTASPEAEVESVVASEELDSVGESTANPETDDDDTAESNEELDIVDETIASAETDDDKLVTKTTASEEKLLTATAGAARYLSAGWNYMKDNPYWSSPVTSIISIEFRESNVPFTHEDMYYTWEDKGIYYYLYEIWETDDHSYTSSGFGAVIQIAEGEKLYAAIDASNLFAGIERLKTIINLEMLDTSKTISFENMFEGCNELEELDLSSFDTSKAINIAGMFKDCSMLSSLDISTFDTKNVRTMKNLFRNASSLETINVSNFDTSNVIKMDYMFATGEKTYNADFEYQEIPSKFTKIVFGDNFKTHNVNNMNGMFYGAAVKKLDLTHFDTSSVTNMCEMFDNCAFLEEIDLSSFDTSNVTDFCAMFADCYRLKSLDLSNFDTAKSEKFRYMFANCYELEVIDVSNFEGKKVTDLCNMFSMDGEATTFVYDDTGYYPIGKTQADSKLTVVDISGIELDVDGVFAYDMFKGARNLTTIYASPKFVNRGKLINYDLFRDCDSLVGGIGTAFDGEHIWSDYAVVDTDETPGYFTDKNDRKFTVTFVTEYGEAPEPITVKNGNTITKPEDLVDEDYIFEYWYLNDENEAFNFDEEITKNIVLTAKWKELPYYTVKFKNTMTNTETEMSVKSGKKVTEAAADSVKGYAFKYWYVEGGNEEAFDFETAITDNINLCSKYEIANYTITYNLNDGSFVEGFTAKETITMFEEYTLPSPDKLTKEEANFLGWYDNKDFDGDAITSIKDVDSNITLYVKWEDFCIITMRPGPTSMDENYIHYGGAPYDVRIKVGEKYTVPVNKAKVFLYYEYNDSCKYLGGQPKTGVSVNEVIYYEAYDEKGWYLGKFYGGEEIVINSKKIIFKSIWWIYGGSQISYDEIIEKYGEPDKDCAVARQKYNERKAASENKPIKNKNSNTKGGGNSGGGGGSSSGGLSLNGINPLNGETNLTANQQAQPNQPTQVQEAPNAVKTQDKAKSASSASYSLSKDAATWTQNSDGTWSMSVNNETGKVAANSGFYSITDVNTTTGAQTNAVYYFDEKGQMATGWVKDAAGSLYFFETANTSDVGKMTTGWKQINGGYYYFGNDGKMLSNGVTPDGYKVGADGVWIA